MLLYLSVTGIAFSLFFLYYNAKKYKSSIYLGLFFFLISLYGVNQYALLYSDSVVLVALIYSNVTFLHYLIGPMLYFYIRSVIKDNSQLTRKDLWHFIPSATYLIAVIPYLITPYSHKVEVAQAILADKGLLMVSKVTFLSNIFSVTTMYLSRPVSVLLYSLWSVGMVVRYLVRHRELEVFHGQNFMIKWLSALLGFSLLLSASTLLMLFDTYVLNYQNLFYSINYLQILSAFGLTGLLLSPLLFPNILYGLPRFDRPASGQPIEEDRKAIEYNFESEYMEQLEEKIEIYMCEFQPYLQPDLNISKFADLIQVPCHHLAYYFREVKKQTFNDYRNENRVNHAKKMIMEGKAESLTLEAIALSSGFTTRNTFFTAFKKTEGISPGIFAAKYNPRLT